MIPKITEGLDAGDDEKVVSILKKWNDGMISNDLFFAISRMTPQVSAIIVIFRKVKDKIETLLIPRPSDDPLGAGKLNLPGKMFRTIDFKRVDKNPVNGPLERIQTGELKINLKNEPEFVENVFQNTGRGAIVALVHLGELSEDSVQGEDWVWADVTKLKELDNFLVTETSAIEAALKHYLAS
jgi:hypothetical protein